MVGVLRVANLEVTQAHVALSARAGVVKLFPLQAQVDGGQYSGDIEWDRRGMETTCMYMEKAMST